MPTERELLLQLDILRTLLREATITIRRMNCGQRINTGAIPKRIELAVTEAKEVAGVALSILGSA